MGMLTEGYRMAMDYYKMVQQNNALIEQLQGKVENTETENKVEDKTDNPKPNFSDLIDKDTSIQAGKSYRVMGYDITIPSLGKSSVQQKVKDMNLDPIIAEASEKFNIPAALIYKVIETESYYNTNCKSSAGAMGLMQLMPFNCTEYGVTDPYDPYQNIMAGTQHLKEYIDRYNGDLKLGLAAYNAGPGNVNKYGGVPPFKETQNYIRKILGVEP